MTVNSLTDTINPSIEKLVAEYSLAWRESREAVDLGSTIDAEEHAIRESALDGFLRRALEKLHNPPSTRNGYTDLQARMLIDLARLGQVTFDLMPGHLENLLQRGLPQSLVHFAKIARLDQHISDDEISSLPERRGGEHRAIAAGPTVRNDACPSSPTAFCTRTQTTTSMTPPFQRQPNARSMAV